MRFEFKKIFNNRIILIALIISCVYMGYYSYTQSRTLDMWSSSTVDVSAYLGAYSVERAQSIKKHYEETEAISHAYPENEELFQNFELYIGLNADVVRCEEVFSYRQRVLKNAKRLKTSNDKYTARLNAKIEKMYRLVPEMLIASEMDTEKIQEKLDCTEYIDLINVMILVIVSCVIFIVEHRRNTYSLIYASYKGRGTTYFRKMMSVILFAIGLAVLTSVFINIFSTKDITVWKTDIQNLDLFMYSPYNFNMITLILVVTMLRIVGYVTLVCIFTAISTCFRSSILPLVINTLLGVGGLILSTFYEGNFMPDTGVIMNKYEIYMMFRKFTPYPFISDGVEYFKVYEPVNILGFPVSMITLNLVVNGVVILLALVVGYQMYIRRFRKWGI